jgi:hypothetical protein
MTYAHSHEAVTTYTAFLESDESPISTISTFTARDMGLGLAATMYLTGNQHSQAGM